MSKPNARGYSLVEVLVTVAILALVMGGFLSLLDTSAKITKAQSAIADVQENVRYVMDRLVRSVRMVGAGGVPPTVEDATATLVAIAVVVEDNVSASHTPIGGRTPLSGTDILVLRGCFTNAIYDMDNSDYTYDATTRAGAFKVRTVSLNGEPQDPSLLEDAVDNTTNPPKWAPLVFAAPADRPIDLGDGHQRSVSQFGVAIAESVTTVDGRPQFAFTTNPTGDDKIAFTNMNRLGVFQAPTNVRVSRVALLNELRYFVAKDEAQIPTLYVQTPGGGASQPIAADIADLQIALGCDINDSGTIETSTSDPPASGDDEWLFNAASETLGALTPGGTPMVAYLSMMRLTLVARVPVADPNYVQRAIFNENGRNLLNDTYLGYSGRNYRYRSMSERIKMRSLGPIL